MKEGLMYFSDTHLTLIGLMIFFVWFSLMTYWVFKKQSPEFQNRMAKMPLNDEETIL